MFKRLRERISEEASKSVAQLGNNASKSSSESDIKTASINTTSEDLITLSESSSVVVPHTSSQQFSIGEDDDGSMSEQSTPQRSVDVSNGSVSNSGIKDRSGGVDGQEYRPKRLSFVPQSDIESEREDPPTLNLEGISKEQLLTVIDLLKARTHKYKNRYTEVVKNYKELKDEKTKIEKALIDTQDKGSRRTAELREQCQLEQKAKAHLEANLRLMLEEKDSLISVLETQNNLLKSSSNTGNLPDQEQLSIGSSNGDLLTGDIVLLPNENNSIFQEKLERMEHQLNQAKKTITAQTDQIALLRKQSENLSQELEEKVKRVNELEDQHTILKAEHEVILSSMQTRLGELEKQQEEDVMCMAETKRNMHVELELKEKQLVKANKEASQYRAAVESERQKMAELQRQHEDRLTELKRQLESTEKTLEDEKQNLMQELARGKTAAITLMKEDCAKQISAIEEEWKTKLLQLQSQDGEEKKNLFDVQEKLKLSEARIQELKSSVLQLENENKFLKSDAEKPKTESEEKKSLVEVQEKLKLSEAQVQELKSKVLQLENENASLKTIAEKIKSGNIKAQNEENMKRLKEKYENAEKNYATQLEEMKQRIATLEKQELESRSAEELKSDNLKKEHAEMTQKLLAKINEQDSLVSKLEAELESSTKESSEKIKEQKCLVLKLEAELESSSKKSSEKIEVLKKRSKALEQEREQLMHEAQDRVSKTEAKFRQDIKLLQEEKSLSENKEINQLKTKASLLEQQLQENLKAAESSKAELSSLREQLSLTEEELQQSKATVAQLSQQLQKSRDENSLLASQATHLESLKFEKEALNEQLKLKVSDCQRLEAEREHQKEEISLAETIKELEISKQQLVEEGERLRRDFNQSKEALSDEISHLKTKNESLSKQIQLLEKVDPSDQRSVSVKDYIASVRLECENAIKAKEDDMASKLKLLVRDFAEQMDLKDRDCDKITSEILERNQDLEERLERECKNQIAELRQNLFERECAYDDMRDDYEERLQEKEKKIKEYESAMKINVSQSMTDSALLTAESSDWDETWAVPDETLDCSTSPEHSHMQCEEHVNEIESLKEDLSKCHSEIKELKVLLRLSPPDSIVNNNNNSRRSSMQSIPEPTEIEYLKNIIYEYMMGKEPITLVKVIAAVLRFNETQTQQVIRKEESRHQTK